MSTDCRIRPEALDAYFHGMLNEAQHREMSAHLLTCPSCNKTLSALEAETYLIGKGLRNVEIPPMSVSAASLVSRYAGTRAPDATTVELPAEQESGQKLQPAPALEVIQPARAAQGAKAPRLSLVRWIAASAAGSVGRRNALATAAAIALVCGAAIWFAATITRRLDDSVSRQLAQKQDFEEWQRHQEEIRRDDENRQARNETALREWKDNVITPMQDKIRQAVNLLQEQDKDRTAIADLQRQLVDLKTTIVQAQADRIQAIESELSQKQEVARLNAQALTNLLGQIKELQQQDAPVVVDADSLALLPVNDLAVTWEEIKGAPGVNALKGAKGVVGWGVTLTLIHAPNDEAPTGGGRSNPTVVVDRAVKAVENRGVENVPEVQARVVLPALGDWPHFNSPVVKDGKVFAGTGWNENGLAAIDSNTGQLKWTYAVHDGGVGAPALSDDGRAVYFATAGGSVYSVTVNGKYNWTCKTGDAVLTQPAVNQHWIYIVHSTRNSPAGFGDKKFPYSITCLHDTDGKVVWTKGLSADAVTSPVIDGAGRVYVATRDGQISIFDGKGVNVSSYSANVSSAPVVAGNSIYFSTWEGASDTGSFEESLSRLGSEIGKGSERLAGPYPAMYLNAKSGTPSDITYNNDQNKNEALAAQHATGPQFRHGWSYLGARPTVIDQTAYVAVGDHLVSFDLRRGKVNWSKKIVGQTEAAASANQSGQGQPSLTPPSYAGGRLYLGSIWGDMLCVDAEKGGIVWRYRLPDAQAVTSQVMLDQGMAYATTAKGNLICINTNDVSATGWNMWGGSPSHNGPVATPSTKYRPDGR